jgi:hypothetical protein
MTPDVTVWFQLHDTQHYDGLSGSSFYGWGGTYTPASILLTYDPVPVGQTPLPAALPLFAGGLLLLGWAARRRTSTNRPQAIC